MPPPMMVQDHEQWMEIVVIKWNMFVFQHHGKLFCGFCCSLFDWYSNNKYNTDLNLCRKDLKYRYVYKLSIHGGGGTRPEREMKGYEFQNKALMSKTNESRKSRNVYHICTSQQFEMCGFAYGLNPHGHCARCPCSRPLTDVLIFGTGLC
jgi:hypothetical protein